MKGLTWALPRSAPQLPRAPVEATRLTETVGLLHTLHLQQLLTSFHQSSRPGSSRVPPTWAGLNLLPPGLPTLCAPGPELRPVFLVGNPV